MVEYRPLELGARPMAGRLTLDQLIRVRILCPQPGALDKRALLFEKFEPPQGAPSFAPR